MAGNNGWEEWSKHVLLELVRLNECYTEVHKDIGDIKIQMASFKIENKVKQRFYAGIWGLIGAIVPTIIMITYLISHAGG